MSQREESLKEALDDLGLAEAPRGRWGDPGETKEFSGTELVNFKKALACVDPLDTAAFWYYLSDTLVIDQQMDARHFVRGWSRAQVLPTDCRIPASERVARAIGITGDPIASNHYRILAQDVKRHYLELGAKKMAPPLIFRTSGANGSRPIMGVIMKFDLTPADGTKWEMAGSWGLLHDKRDPTNEEKQRWSELHSSST